MTSRPDLADALNEVLGVEPGAEDYLAGLTIGEVGVCYEALLALIDREDRKSAGQYFTPDDAARFMAEQSADFDEGVWLDPCCGVGNLSWHLASVQGAPGAFVRDCLVLIDTDEIALRTAVAIISADWADIGDQEAVRSLSARSKRRDFLSSTKLPAHDYVIVNPPYARTDMRDGFETAPARDLFAYFLEKVAKSSKGFISVTPASYLAAPKFQSLRNVVDSHFNGGRLYAFDNVPDTLFRGYKFGSNNTSKTNFVRAAITVCAPTLTAWQVTPIIRWTSATRGLMFRECSGLLAPRRKGPHGEWAKISPGMERIWDDLVASDETIADLVVNRETSWSLDVGLTPRYYISATRRSLDRGSKATLYFGNEADRDRAALTLNSSIPYLWWRALDGGVTLPRRVLMSTPVPVVRSPQWVLDALWESERDNLVVKINAGRENENVKHSPMLVEALNNLTIPGGHDLRLLYASSMFPLPIY
ncbi:N-6 DNA methylase [Salinibacterium sp. NG22]|uniref:N-6 DNA methylase n=1 Tax=Salinibacterium sp. NG22 TaxID=2792040 RepID=UPI0018CD4424|nr:N-6 DNA methylase [Salinibacterium sp. NG22]MBH0110835.1 N-6 DNA methylase [Salinibacterium sp. NG22]